MKKFLNFANIGPILTLLGLNDLKFGQQFISEIKTSIFNRFSDRKLIAILFLWKTVPRILCIEWEKKPIQQNEVTIVEDLFSLIRSVTMVLM